MGETTHRQQRAAIPATASLQVDPERIQRMWAMRADERIRAAHEGQFTLREMLRWASRRPNEVDGEFWFITAHLADAAAAEEERVLTSQATGTIGTANVGAAPTAASISPTGPKPRTRARTLSSRSRSTCSPAPAASRWASSRQAHASRPTSATPTPLTPTSATSARRTPGAVFCNPDDEDRWTRRHQRLKRYHAQADRPPLAPGWPG